METARRRGISYTVLACEFFYTVSETSQLNCQLSCHLFTETL